MEHKEITDKELDLRVMADTIVMLSSAVQTQNDIILCLLHKFNPETDLPTWQDKEAFEKEMAAKADACGKAIRKIYGRSETDKD